MFRHVQYAIPPKSTKNDHHAPKIRLETQCGTIGMHVGTPVPMAYLPIGRMRTSQLADIEAHGRAIVNFCTQEKIDTERYGPEGN